MLVASTGLFDDYHFWVASAFTPNPNANEQDRAPVYVSNDGGNTWRLETIIPSGLMTDDITVSGNQFGSLLVEKMPLK
jgi:hypothetical protein